MKVDSTKFLWSESNFNETQKKFLKLSTLHSIRLYLPTLCHTITFVDTGLPFLPQLMNAYWISKLKSPVLSRKNEAWLSTGPILTKLEWDHYRFILLHFKKHLSKRFISSRVIARRKKHKNKAISRSNWWPPPFF